MSGNQHRFAIVEAPSILGLFPRGVETLPDALLKARLGDRLRAEHRGRVEPPPYDDRRDPGTLLLNPHGIAEYSIALADTVAPLTARS
jgi:arginase